MRKKRSIAKSRAASLKGWRTRQRMVQERKPKIEPEEEWTAPWDDIDIDQRRPPYMDRALPNPWLAK